MKQLLIIIISFIAVIAIILFIFLWQVGILGAMIDCDTTDYSPIIKKVAVPMQTELEGFYTKNKRFPTAKERNEMLEKVGCVMDEGCLFEKHKMIIHTWKTSYDYSLRIDFGNTGCLFSISKSGRHTKVSCGNAPCINLRQ